MATAIVETPSVVRARETRERASRARDAGDARARRETESSIARERETGTIEGADRMNE